MLVRAGRETREARRTSTGSTPSGATRRQRGNRSGQGPESCLPGPSDRPLDCRSVGVATSSPTARHRDDLGACMRARPDTGDSAPQDSNRTAPVVLVAPPFVSSRRRTPRKAATLERGAVVRAAVHSLLDERVDRHARSRLTGGRPNARWSVLSTLVAVPRVVRRK